MEKHIKNYMEYMGYGEEDFIPCEVSFDEKKNGKPKLVRATDIHHIVYRSHGGSDDFENLIAVCREVHDKIHNENWSKEKVLSHKKKPGFAEKYLV